MRVFVGCEEDGETCYCHGDGDEGEEEAVFEEIGEEGDDERENEGCGPGWDGMELGADLAVAVGFNDAGGEEGVASGTALRGYVGEDGSGLPIGWYD